MLCSFHPGYGMAVGSYGVLCFVQELMLILTGNSLEVIELVFSKYIFFAISRQFPSSLIIVVMLRLTNKSRVPSESSLQNTHSIGGAQSLRIDCCHAKRYLTYVYRIIANVINMKGILNTFEREISRRRQWTENQHRITNETIARHIHSRQKVFISALIKRTNSLCNIFNRNCTF